MPYTKSGAGFSRNEFLANFHYTTLGGTLADSGLVANTYGNKVVKRGTVIARVTDSTRPTYQQLMVKVPTATYGPGSNVPVGILLNDIDLTDAPKEAAFVTHASVYPNLIIEDGAFGVTAATKVALTHIQWIDPN